MNKEPSHLELNLTFYDPKKDLYSDGNVENDIINFIKSNDEKNYSKIIYNNFSWPTFYHLTHFRKNLLNWYDFKENSDVLEIGAGMGALTEVLCEKCGTVTAVELSKRRAEAVSYRCADKKNLEIIVGNLNDVKFDKQFDYITLIGVLEYQCKYTDSKNPFVDFLKKVKSFLKPDGKLLIAIENKYGLKYWCGSCEDHTGFPFEGMNQYGFNKGVAQTFSREELSSLLQKSGFSKMNFFYPMPDYKLPSVVFSDDCLPKKGQLDSVVQYYIPSNSTLIANEKRMYDDIIENNTFKFFANSFLVECGSDEIQYSKVRYASCSTERKPEYCVYTVIDKDNNVTKYPFSEYSESHVKQMFENTKKLLKNGLSIADCRLNGKGCSSDFYSNITLEEKLKSLSDEERIDEMIQLINRFMDYVESFSEHTSSENNIVFELGLTDNKNANYGKILKSGYIDMIFRNCFVDGDKYVFFDQEWQMENVPSTFILFRALISINIPIDIFVDFYKLRDVWNIYLELENKFQNDVLDVEHFKAFSNIRTNADKYIYNNVYGLIESESAKLKRYENLFVGKYKDIIKRGLTNVTINQNKDNGIAVVDTSLLLSKNETDDLYSLRRFGIEILNESCETTICVVAYNRPEITRTCVESIIKYTSGINYKLILVFNGNEENAQILDYFNEVDHANKQVIHITHNAGAPFAYMQVSRYVEGKYFVHVPNDVIVTSNWLENLIKCAESDEKIGMVNPCSSNVSNLQQVEIAFKNYDEMQRKAKEYNLSDPDKWHERIRVVTLATLFKRECLETIGPVFDLGFNHNFGDDDVSFRVRRAGYKNIVAFDTWVHHDHSFDLRNPEKLNNDLNNGREKFRKKYFGIDAWDDTVNFAYPYICDSLNITGENEVNILGINTKCGTPILDLKNILRLNKVYNVKMNAFTTDSKYYLDLQTVTDNKVVSDRIDYLYSSFKSNSMDYIIIGDDINSFSEPERVIRDAFALLKKDGQMFFKLKNTFNIFTLLKSLGHEIPYSENTVHRSIEQFIESIILMGIKDIQIINKSNYNDNSILDDFIINVINEFAPDQISKNEVFAKIKIDRYWLKIVK